MNRRAFIKMTAALSLAAVAPPLPAQSLDPVTVTILPPELAHKPRLEFRREFNITMYGGDSLNIDWSFGAHGAPVTGRARITFETRPNMPRTVLTRYRAIVVEGWRAADIEVFDENDRLVASALALVTLDG